MYDAGSSAGGSILAAIYDGPFETQNFTNRAVILESAPALGNGGSALEAVDVLPGEWIIDTDGKINTLGEGVAYFPTGCSSPDCAQIYSGDQPVRMDQWALRFQLLPELRWSDGEPLTADDSLYSFEVASALYPHALPELLDRTQEYRALDDWLIEWRGIPGYKDSDAASKFFSPLPRHAWGSMSAAELRLSDQATKQPLGWGAYILERWIPGEQIILRRNPLYFQADKGLPFFDNLIFRFVQGAEAALLALETGQCDLAAPTALGEVQLTKLEKLQGEGKLAIWIWPETAWEHLVFDIAPLDPQQMPFFGQKEVRQAIGLCIDRQAIAERILSGLSSVAQAYLPPGHPAYSTEIVLQDFDPERGAALLQFAGWVDLDGDPLTPRTAQTVPGIPDGTPFQVDYLASSESSSQEAAQMIRQYLGQCGIGVKPVFQSPQDYLAPGPDGPVFGRKFALAQFAWPSTARPACFLYLSSEIPAPFPTAPKGWGGANAGGYSSAAFDQACQEASSMLPDAPGFREAQQQVQRIMVEDLPVLPLYWRFRIAVSRSDLCALELDASSQNFLWNLENLNYGENCKHPLTEK